MPPPAKAVTRRKDRRLTSVVSIRPPSYIPSALQTPTAAGFLVRFAAISAAVWIALRMRR